MKRLLSIFDIALSDYLAIWSLLAFILSIIFWSRIAELAILMSRCAGGCQ